MWAFSCFSSLPGGDPVCQETHKQHQRPKEHQPTGSGPLQCWCGTERSGHPVWNPDSLSRAQWGKLLTFTMSRSGVCFLGCCLPHAKNFNPFQTLDVPRVLTKLRSQRMMMVQTLAQYTFIYKVLTQYLRNSRLIWVERLSSLTCTAEGLCEAALMMMQLRVNLLNVAVSIWW